jgi:hypothetical protein
MQSASIVLWQQPCKSSCNTPNLFTAAPLSALPFLVTVFEQARTAIAVFALATESDGG